MGFSNMYFFSQKQIDEMIFEAKRSPRLRSHLSLHKSHQDPVQRVIIALASGTYIPPHYHEHLHQWEHFQIIDGEIDVLLFNHKGSLESRYVLGKKTGCFIIQIPPLIPHTILCRTPHAIVLEIKEGPFDPSCAKIIPHWSINENCQTIKSNDIVGMLRELNIGQRFGFNL